MDKLKTYLVKRPANVPDALESIINHYLRTAPLPVLVEHWAEANGAKKELPEHWIDNLGDLQAAIKFNELF